MPSQTVTRSSRTRSAPVAPAVAATAPRLDRAAPDAPAQTGTYVPTAYFRRVTGQVVDTDGDPIRDAKLLMGREGLPTGAVVDDEGRFELLTLKRSVSDFVLIGSSGRDEPDYAWYQPVDTRIGSRENNVTLTFRVRRLTGLFGGSGVDFGGQLG